MKRPFLKKILITAGPTREMLDPVRFISNVSTGEMGYALARAAKRRGYEVTLVSGPTGLKPPAGIRFVSVLSADEMRKACETFFPRSDALVMVAAVCDFTPKQRHSQKIKRTRTQRVELKRTPDIVAGVASRKAERIVIGFCLETEKWLENAEAKVKRKNLDGIVANYYSGRNIPFGKRRIDTAFVAPDGSVRRLRNIAKPAVAVKLLAWLEQLSERKRAV